MSGQICAVPGVRHALDVSDILYEIIGLLPTRDQLHFGLVNRTIWEVAASLLWRHVADMGALRSLLPDDLTLRGDYSQEVVLLPNLAGGVWRPLTTGEWQPFLNYARYIQSLKLSDESFHPLGDEPVEDIFRLLTMCPGEAIPLPNLKSLSTSLMFDDSITACTRFMEKQRVSQLDMSIWNGMEVYLSNVRLLVQSIAQHTDMENLSLKFHNFRWPCEQLSKALNLIVRADSLPSLRHFCLSTSSHSASHYLQDNFAGELLHLLAQLPRLESVEVDSFPSFTRFDTSNAFLALKSFTIKRNGHNYPIRGDLAILLNSIRSRSVTKLELTSLLPDLQDVLGVISSRWAATLKTFGLDIFGDNNEDSIPSYAFQSLSALQSLGRLAILTSFCFSDDHFDVLTAALPSLHSFAMRCYYTPAATQRSLVYFARRCPALHRLCMSINFDESQTGADIHDPVPVASNLAIFDASYSVCTHPMSAVNFLRATFPQLKAFGHEWGLEEVERLLSLPAPQPE